jgi:copper(I)-binding protein
VIRLLPAIGALLLTGCLAPDEISIDDAWVRLAAVKGNPAAAYFTVHGGPTDATIIAAYSDVSIKSEMHESMGGGGMASMKPLSSVRVPANTDVAFKPGGKHVMLYDMNPGIVPGGRPVLITLSFADGTRLSRKAVVYGAGDPGPE